MNTIGVMDADSILAHWDDASDLLTVALDYSWQNGDTLPDVMEQLAAGKADMVEIRRSGQLVAVAVIETFERKDGEWLNVWALAGEGMDAWIGDFVAWLQNAAQTWGLRGVMCGGRPGWEKALRALGWTKRSVVMEKQLCH